MVLTRIHNSGSGQTLKFKDAFTSVYESYVNTLKMGKDQPWQPDLTDTQGKEEQS